MTTNEEVQNLFGVSEEEMSKTEGIIPTLDVTNFIYSPIIVMCAYVFYDIV